MTRYVTEAQLSKAVDRLEKSMMQFLSEADAPKPKAKAKKAKRVVKPTRIELPKGWENVEGMKDLRRLSYIEARAEGLSYKASNEAGLNAVRKALA